MSSHSLEPIEEVQTESAPISVFSDYCLMSSKWQHLTISLLQVCPASFDKNPGPCVQVLAPRMWDWVNARPGISTWLRSHKLHINTHKGEGEGKSRVIVHNTRVRMSLEQSYCPLARGWHTFN